MDYLILQKNLLFCNTFLLICHIFDIIHMEVINMKIKVNKEDVKKFNESDIGKTKNAYLKRSTIIGIILIMFGLIYLLFNIYNNSNIFDYIVSILALLFGIYFIINSSIIKKKEVNKYIYNEKNKASK